MPPPASPFLRRHGFVLALGALLAVSFLVYLRYNQRYVGAVDWYSYYQEALLLKSGRLTLPMELPPATFPAAVPLGFHANAAGEAVTQYPPGYPLLLAIAAVFHAEFFLMPLLGIVSGLVFFLLARDLTGDRVAAAVFAALWLFCPIVVYGSTSIMSDLPAALSLMASYWLYRRGQVGWSAGVFGFALWVRPTNLLYAAVFAFLLRRDRRLVRFGLGVAAPIVLYALYNYALFGAPWRTGYDNLGQDLGTEFFVSHLGFYLGQCLWQVGPIVVLFGVGIARGRTGEELFLAVWFGVFLLFYCFWRSGEDAWWWTRFLLPGFAPVFLLAALGFSRLRAALQGRAGHFALWALVGLTPFYYIGFGRYQGDLWHLSKGYSYYQAVRETAAAVPAGSYVGSVEFSGALRIYSPLKSFVSLHPNAPQLVGELLRQGRGVYLLVEPQRKGDEAVQRLLRRFTAEKVRVINVWGGVPLYRLHPPAAP